MKMIEFLKQHWQELGIGGGFLGLFYWLTNRKIKQADAFAKMQESYAIYLKHDSEERNGLVKRIECLEQNLSELGKENRLQRQENLELQEQIRMWESRYNGLEKKYNVLKTSHAKLKSEFEKYRKLHNSN